MHVGHQLRLPLARGRAAHAAIQGNAHAGRLALEGSKNQLGAIKKIKARPVQIGQGLVGQRAQVGGVGDAVGFAFQQRAGLRHQFGIQGGLGVGDDRGGFKHGDKCNCTGGFRCR
ncbi:hypothetical protein D3C72_1798190 [compost metagenome]